MKPVIERHLDYRGFLTRRIQRYWISWRSQPASVREIFLNLDLSDVDRIMMDCYSVLGAAPRQPSCMMRSLLLMMGNKCSSIPLWVLTLHTFPFYAILNGFDPKAVPGVGTFYDFLDRLWNLDSDIISSHLKLPVTKKVKKPKVKGQKADLIEEESVEQLIARLSGVIFRVNDEAYGILFRIFLSCFLEKSIRRG